MEGLERCRTKFTVDLHPNRLADAPQGVRSHLSSLLLRYNDDLDGVLLAYSNDRVLTRQASIHPYFPFVRVQVAADVLLFRPRQGSRLVGTVNKVGADYVGLLLLGFLNVSIAADQIRAEFRARPMEHCWVSNKSSRHRLEVGAKVHFRVAAVRHHGHFLSIAGSLQQPDTGADGFVAAVAAPAAGTKTQQQQQQQQHRKQKKMRKGEEKGQPPSQAAAPPPAQQQQQAHAAEQSAGGKKAKKRKQAAAAEAPPAAQQQPQQQQQNGADAAPSPGKKAKKRKAGAALEARQPAAAPAAAAVAANGGIEGKPKKKKQKQKH